MADKVALLADWSRPAAGGRRRRPRERRCSAGAREQVLRRPPGTTTTQQRVRIYPQLEVARRRPTTRASSTRCAPSRRRSAAAGSTSPTASGTGTPSWPQLPDLLAEKLAAPTVEAGRYDLVIDPSNLWLTIHESIGHATELDRALGYEANYAGTASPPSTSSARCSTARRTMNVTGDRTAEHGLATIGYDDEGVATQSWDLVKDGVLVGYQIDRRMAADDGLRTARTAARTPTRPATSRSSGWPTCRCSRPPTDRVDRRPDRRVERGIYIVGDKSWSIDMQRYNFQFTGQRFYGSSDGQLDGQVRDVAYQATTTDFWGSMEAVGGPQT